MTPRSRRRLAVSMAALALLVAHPAPAPADAGGPSGTDRDSTAEVVHRVVWDAYQPHRWGIHLRSANLDGTERRRTYDLDLGFTLYLTLSPDGKVVAFSTCCRISLPQMVLVPVDGGEAVNPLARYPKIDFVGGIGWSPDGRRLAFEGTTGTYPHRHTYLWTIRPDGTGLRRLFDFGSVRHYLHINDALAWTRAGIMYSDGRNLRSVKAGESRLVLRRVSSVHISGDGSCIVTSRRRDDGGAVWIGKPDGTDQHRVASFDEASGDPTYNDVTPSYDCSALLAYRSTMDQDDGTLGQDDVVTWQVASGPETATVVDVVDGNFTSSWNKQRASRDGLVGSSRRAVRD